MTTNNRGFASMDENKRRDVASKGGKTSQKDSDMNSKDANRNAKKEGTARMNE